MIEADGYWRVSNHAWQMIACSHLFSLISDGFNCRTCWRRHAFVSLIGGGSVVRIVWKKVGRVRIWLTWVSSHVLVFSDRDVALMSGLVLCSPNAIDLLWHHFSLTGRGGHDLDGWFVMSTSHRLLRQSKLQATPLSKYKMWSILFTVYLPLCFYYCQWSWCSHSIWGDVVIWRGGW
jgi:hypothetical protein